MLQFNYQYNISYPIFLTFNKKKHIHNVYHSPEVKERYKKFYYFSKFETYTKEKYKLTVIYCMFKFNISSYTALLQKLNVIDFSEVYNFRDSLVNYRTYIKNDIDYLVSKYGKPSDVNVLSEYYAYKINFYTCWWYLKYSGTLEKNENSILYKPLLSQIQMLLYYVKFKESVLEEVKGIMLQSNLLEDIS